MRKHYIISVIFVLFLLIPYIGYGESSEQIMRNQLVGVSNSEYPDSLIDGSIFHFDDSLLCTYYPEARVKPMRREVAQAVSSHALNLHYTPYNPTTPYYLIITTQTLFDSLQNEIKIYAEDVHTIHGYGIYIEVVDNMTPEQMKSLIIGYKTNLCGVMFIGDLGESYFEIEDDYNKYGYRKWPCDLFFTDLDGVWTDEDENGVYDKHTGNVAPEIFLGRLSTAGLSSLGNEIALIRRQLEKSHQYWWNSSFLSADTILNYIDEDWNYMFLSNEIKPVFGSSAIVDDIRYGTDAVFSATDYISRFSKNEYGFTHLAAHSAPNLHRIADQYVYVNNIKNNNAYSYAYNLFCCSACNWVSNSTQGYLGGVYLFNKGRTLAVVGSTKTGGMLGTKIFYSHLSSKNLGMAFQQWWKDYYGTGHTDFEISWSYGMTILGDPTIKFQHRVSDYCEENLILSRFPSENTSNLIMYKAEKSITIREDFSIPEGVHVIFDAPKVKFEKNISVPIGASFETRNEGCEL